MKLFNIQKKFIEAKPCEKNIIKGKSNSGKSEALLHRVLYLINNYAYESNDRILFVQKSEGFKEKIKTRFKEMREENKYNYFSLLAAEVEPEFLSLKELVSNFTKRQLIITNLEKSELLKRIINSNEFKNCKKIKDDNINMIISEIKYIKNNNVTSEEEYMTLMGAPLKLRKNSKSRCDMYKLFELYNDELKERNLNDEEGVIKDAKGNTTLCDDRYVHIFIDNAEELSKLELEFLLALYERKAYGTITIGVDVDKAENVYSALVKKGRVYGKKIFGDKKKLYNFKNSIEDMQQEKLQKFKPITVMEDYTFFSIKNRNGMQFAKDTGGYEEKFIGQDNQEFTNDEMEAIPVFNNIAAGEPILIAPEQEDTFTLPKYWVKGGNKKFILKVKGDSMIDANIHNEDLVVIEQTQAPVSGDIVAVNIDGNATLKTLEIGHDEVILMPENKNYEPIRVSKYDEFYVLGKAVGIVRKGRCAI